MSFSVTNRVYLPDEVVQRERFIDNRIYVSDDQFGDKRLEELYKTYGNLTVEACYKDSGKYLDDLKPFWRGTIEQFFSEGGTAL